MVSYEKSKQTVETNVLGTANFLEAIKNIKSVKAAIIVTTDKVYLNLEKKKRSLKKVQDWEDMISIAPVKHVKL